MSKTSKDGQVGEVILKYLNAQNRPYSANDVFNNLHKEYGKTAVERALDVLADTGRIQRKLNGKQKAYVADQSQFPDIDDKELKSMEASITKLTDQLKTAQETNDKLSSELRSLNNALTTDAARKQLVELTEKVEQATAKLNDLKSMGKKVSPEERQKVMKTREVYVKEWRKRKRISSDILNAILEGYPKKKKDLYENVYKFNSDAFYVSAFKEDIGIETDEDYKVSPPEI